MVTVTVRLALDAFVMTPAGPAPVPSLQRGSPVYVIVGGVPTKAAVTAVSSPSDGDTHRLFTAVGDICVPTDEMLITRKGAVRASAVAGEVMRGGEVRLELVNPSVLHTTPRKRSRASAVEGLLRTLDPAVVQLPAPVGDELRDDVEALLKEAGARYTVVDDERWLTFIIADVPKAGGKGRADHLAEALLLLTAWGWENDCLVSRTRLDAVRTRAHLIAALVSEGEPFEARWTPGYRPVECRLFRPSDSRWPPFVRVVSLLTERAGFVEVTTSRKGALIVGLAVSGPVA